MKIQRFLFALLVFLAPTSAVVAQESERSQHTVPIGRIQLEAELVWPQGGQDVKGAVVFATGSGGRSFRDYPPGVREQLIESIYLPRDIAVFYVNKRGAGESTGDWRLGSIERRAEDILAAVEYLRQMPEIDPDGIGLIGHSQGGWVVQLAGSQDPRLAHVVSLAGPTVSVREQDLRRTEISLECEGIVGEELEQGLAQRDRAHRMMIFFGGWFPFFQLRLMHNILPYDPAEALQATTVPTLLAYGELDEQAPPEHSRDRLTEIFPEGVPENITFYAAPQGDHYLRVRDSHCPDTEFIERPFSQEFREFLGNWLDSIASRPVGG